MGGQAGFSRDLLAYSTESNVLMGGFTVHPNDRWDLGLHLVWTSSEAGLAPFDLPADDYVAITPPAVFDFSETHTYSDLDTTRIDGEVSAKYQINDEFRLYGAWRYADFSDDAPYLYDTSGSFTMYTFALGWTF